jgi:branched-chain amino acid transport system ATP-binding protein
MILNIQDLCVNYDELEVLKGVSLEIPEGEISLLLGANGSGKSTLMRAISGLIHPISGSIRFQGKRIDRMAAHDVFKLGIVQMSEGFSVFAKMNVMDNLKLGSDQRKDHLDIKKDRENIFQRFPVLKQKQKMDASKMSGGEQQLLCVARTLLAKPKIILMDEPSKGLSPVAVDKVADCVTEISKMGITIILVEHNLRLGLSLAQNVFVLENGTIAFKTRASDLAQVEYAKKIYLGG